MKVEQRFYTPESGWEIVTPTTSAPEAFQLVFAFGKDTIITEPAVYESLKSFYPKAHIVLASDNGEIIDTRVTDYAIGVSALHFEKSSVEAVAETVMKDSSFDTGKKLAQRLTKEGLKHVLVISEGLNINGSALIEGIRSEFSHEVTMSGGLAADNMKFVKTYVGLDATPSDESTVVLIGFYGENFRIGLGSVGGWDTFGPKRLITKSVGNVVYEIDGQPALDLYKTYLGEFAVDLPGSGLLFPLSIQAKDSDITLVRTLLSIDEAAKSITYAGDVPEGSIAWLMKANFERVIEGAGLAAKNGIESVQDSEFALLISCAGRKAILKQRVEEEIENVRYILGDTTKIGGFYSFGEVGPKGDIQSCYLHNQTMTVNLFKEI